MENRKEVYFDNSATARVFDSVRDVMVEAMTSDYGNTSSRHMKGVEAERYIREAREETGLTLTDYRYRGIVTFVSDRWPTEYMHLFTADGFTGTLKECDEGDLEWIPKSHLLELPTGRGTPSSWPCWTGRKSRFSPSSCGMRGRLWRRRCSTGPT